MRTPGDSVLTPSDTRQTSPRRKRTSRVSPSGLDELIQMRARAIDLHGVSGVAPSFASSPMELLTYRVTSRGKSTAASRASSKLSYQSNHASVVTNGGGGGLAGSIECALEASTTAQRRGHNIITPSWREAKQDRRH